MGDIISFDCNTVVSQCISEVCRFQILTCKKRCLMTMDDFLFFFRCHYSLAIVDCEVFEFCLLIYIVEISLL